MIYTPDEIFHLTWRGVAFDMAYFAAWAKSAVGPVMTRLELTVPGKEPLPLTDTGYCGCTQYLETIMKAGGPVSYILACLDAAAESDKWCQQEFERRQLSLF